RFFVDLGGRLGTCTLHAKRVRAMTLTSEYRLILPRATYLAARARNAMHRPIFIGAVSVGTFVTALVALVIVPQQAQRAAQAIAPKPGERPDTVVLANAVAGANARIA